MGVGVMNDSIQVRKGIKPETLFLIIASIFGTIYVLFQPLFIEPDSSFHFDKTTYISNTVVDRGSLGFTGEDYQHNYEYFTNEYKMGTYFDKFFIKKLPVIDRSNVQDKRAIGSSWKNNIMHIVPGLGVKFGWRVYPSIGIMIIFGRLFNFIFFIFCMYFIIKRLKVYQLGFAIVSVTPTVIQMAASLSYDCYAYISFAFMATTLLNIANDIYNEQRISWSNFAIRLLPASIMLYFSKANMKLLFLLIIVLSVYFIGKHFRIIISKKAWLFGIISSFLLGITGFIVLYHSQLALIIKKFIYTLLEPNYTVLSTEIIGGTIGRIPLWFFPVQVAGLLFLFFSYKKEKIPKWFAISFLGVALINLFGVNFQYAINSNFNERIITGSQGRYFTSFLLLLFPVFNMLSSRGYIIVSGKLVKRLIVIISIFALVLNFTIISVKFYHLQVPTNRFRSDINSIIFK